MKVLISYLFSTKGGVETALANRLRMINPDYEVDLHFFADYGGMSIFDGFNGSVFVESNQNNVKSIIDSNGYDIVISIDSIDILKILREANYSGKIGLEVHTTYAEGLTYLKSSLVHDIDFVIVPSVYQKTLIQSVLSDIKIYVLGNAINDNIFYIKDSKWQQKKKIVLWVGRIDPHKNWKLFLKIASKLYVKNSDYYFWVVGGLKSDPLEIDKFEKTIYELNLEKCLRWIPQVNYQNIREIYSMAANSGGCYISTSQNESFGMTIIEAMICRCPVIVNCVGALSELVQDGRGLCLDNLEDHIDEIKNFIDMSDKQTLLNNAMNYVNDNYSCRSIGQKFIHILNEVIYNQAQ